MIHEDKPPLSELRHYGVKGMRWGVRKDRETRRENKGKKFDQKVSDINSKIDAHKGGRKKGYIQKLESDRDRYAEDAQRVRDGKMTTRQKKVAIGAAVAATLVAAKATQVGIESGEFRRMADQGRAFLNLEHGFKKNPDLASVTRPDQVFLKVVKQVNPEYGAVGRKMNCRRATFAYEMRRRGYDVQATRTTNGYGQNISGLKNAISPGEKLRRTGTMSLIWDFANEKVRSGKDPSMPTPLKNLQEGLSAGSKKNIGYDSFGEDAMPRKIFERLAKEPNGSRGEIGVIWKQGGGHSMAYEIFDGKPVIFDAQTGKAFDSVKAMSDSMDIGGAGFTRLDNLDLNTDYLRRWVRNAG